MNYLISLKDYTLPCINKKLFGFDCLGCGMQRSLLLILQGDFMAAFKMYPAIYSLFILISFIGLNFKFQFNNSQFIIRTLFVINLILVVGNFVLKLI